MAADSSAPRAVILAAGRGSRLGPLTAERPKCLVPLFGRSLLERQIDALAAAGIEDLSVVVGYRAEAVDDGRVTPVFNPRHLQTNMVVSLFCARALFDGSRDLVMVYGDIVFEPRIVRTLCANPRPVAVAVDLGWRKLWSLRMDDPLSDAETLRMSDDGRLLELGRKPDSYEDIEGQYIGAVRFSRAIQNRVCHHYDRLAALQAQGKRDLDNLYMTDFIQSLIDAGLDVGAACFEHGWLEVDSVQDLERYARARDDGRLGEIVDLG